MRGTCEKCGVEHLTPLGYPACKAHRSKTGTACRANPVRGAAVCSKHGMTGAVRKNAAARVAEAEIARTMGDLLRQHDIPEQHPFAALLELSRRMGAMTRTLEQLVTEFRTSGEDDRLQAALGLYERFGRLSAQVSKTVLDANLDERLVLLEEARVEVVFTALMQAMRTVGLSVVQQEAMRDAVAEHLRAHRPQAPALG